MFALQQASCSGGASGIFISPSKIMEAERSSRICGDPEIRVICLLRLSKISRCVALVLDVRTGTLRNHTL